MRETDTFPYSATSTQLNLSVSTSPYTYWPAKLQAFGKQSAVITQIKIGWKRTCAQVVETPSISTVQSPNLELGYLITSNILDQLGTLDVLMRGPCEEQQG